MALPTTTEILTGAYSYDGSPYIEIASSASQNLDTLEYSYDGSPWNGTEQAATSSEIKSVNGVLLASIKSVNGVAIASIKSHMGLTP